MKLLRWEVLVLFLCVFFLSEPSYAYVDPGVGQLIWQGLIAVGVGALFSVRRLFGALAKKKK